MPEEPASVSPNGRSVLVRVDTGGYDHGAKRRLIAVDLAVALYPGREVGEVLDAARRIEQYLKEG
jgi:hypothetical protein